MRLVFTSVLLLVISINFSTAQLKPLNTDSIRKTLNPGEEKFVIEHIVNGIATKREIKSSASIDVRKEEQYIVRFKENPLLIAKKLKSSGNAARINSEHNQFSKDLAQLISKASGTNLKSAKQLINREFKTILNGVSVSLTSTMVNEIKKLNYVSKVEKDEIVRINDNESNNAIKVPEVWEKLGFTGKGVTIAIIDTGVDTAHVCFSGDKFVKGYDFINHDDDPFDDNSHGTHCAGIAAANSDQIKGVAPEAKIMPVKVLGQDGNGLNSTVIAGIEFAVDPDQNPDTNDGAKVISMSLGGTGTPEDALSTAVNNAVECGVVCVVAAGNASQYYSVQSPGCASNAVTVGSCNNSGKTSGFSSKGPCLISHAIKPDIMAPGENIYSSIPGNNYENKSGTSMATPHVAGLAALILQKNPEWRPDYVKSDLIQSAQNNEASVLDEGFGMVNALKSIEDVLPVLPHTIDLGIINPKQGEIVQSKQVQITNTSTDIQEISLSTAVTQPGITISVSRNKFILLPNETKPIDVKITLNTFLVSGLPSIPVLSSQINVFDGKNNYKIPVTCLIGNLIKITSDVPPDLCALYNANWDSVINVPIIEQSQSILLGTRKTDLLMAFNNFQGYFLEENIQENKQGIHINPSSMTNTVKVKAFSPTGERLNLVESNEEIRKNGDLYNGFRLIRFTVFVGNNYDLPDIKKQFTTISANFCYEANLTAYPSFNKSINHLIKVPFGLNQGVSKSMVVNINSSDYKKLKLNIDLKELDDSIYYTTDYYFTESWATDLFNKKINYITPKSTFDFYMLPEPYPNFKITSGTRFAFWKKLPVNYPNDIPLLVTEYLYMDKSRLLSVRNPNFGSRDTLKNDILPLNENLSSPGNIFNNNNTLNLNEIKLNGSNFETYNIPLIVTIRNGSKISSIDTLTYGFTYNYEFYNRPSDRNRNYPKRDTVLVTTTYGFDEKVQANTTFQYVSADNDYSSSDFPRKIELSGNTDQNKYFLSGQNRNILIQTYYTPMAWIRKYGDKTWEKLQVTTLGDFKHKTQSLANYKNGYYDLKIETSSTQGESFAQWSPAFQILSETQSDSLMLVELYKNTNGEQWTNNKGWLKENLANWQGITIIEGRVTKIELQNNNLRGSITNGLRNLDKLNTLNVSDNKIELIPDLSKLLSLNVLFVQNNKLDFASIVPNRAIKTYKYAPQDTIYFNYNESGLLGDELHFNVKSVSKGNHYSWSVNDKLTNEVDTCYYISIPEHPGIQIYQCTVTNLSLPELTLYTPKAHINIQERKFHQEKTLLGNLNSSNIIESNWVDVDNDGDEDLFLASSDFGKSKLLINKLKETGQITFEECTDPKIYQAILPVCAANWVDINNDGLTDLIAICNKGGDNLHSYLTVQIFENQGDLKFKKKAFDLLQNKETSNILQSFNLVDHNNDNFIDIITNHQEWIINQGAYTKSRLIQNNNGFADTLSTECSKYEGKVTACDILDNDGTELVDTYFSFSIYKGSYNSCNSSRTNENTILTNYINTTYAPSIGDLDNDGDLDVFIPIYNYFNTQGSFNNTLYENKNNNFELRSDLSPTIKSVPTTSGSVLFDFDNDGDLDLAVSNNGQRNELYKNLYMESGKLDFEKIISESFDDEVDYWKGISVSDVNMDGYLDLTKLNYLGMTVLLNENKGNNWLGVNCKGKTSNGSAMFAKVYAIANINGKRTVQYRQILSNSGEAANTSRRLNFGLGNASIVDSLIIEWPSGIINVRTNLKVNQYLDIVECLNPTSVANLNATYSNGEIKLSWSNELPDETKYIIEYVKSNTGEISEIVVTDTIPSTLLSWKMAADPKYAYYFRLKSITDCGSESKTAFIKSQFKTGIDEQNTYTLIYPNPAEDVLYIESNEITTPTELLMYDMKGNIVLRKKIAPYPQKILIDIHNLKTGAYTLETCAGDKSIFSKIIVK